MHRSGFAIAALLLVAACQSEPSFEERYGSAEQEIRERAAGIDADLARQGSAAGAPSEAPVP